jgi:hypothetical protein
LADRVVGSVGRADIGFFVYPGISQSYFRFIVATIARGARVPIGFEEMAQAPDPFERTLASVPDEERTILLGLSVREALDALVEADGRYAWREQDGVLLIRPVTAWRDGSHFLLQRAGPVDAKPQRAMSIVRSFYASQGLDIKSAGGGLIGEVGGSRELLRKPVTLMRTGGSLLDALNAIVKAHGELIWMVSYRFGPVALGTSCIRMMTFDGLFGEIGPVACASPH